MTLSNLDPGYDFYQYVNHAWLTNPLNQIPEDYSSWGGFTKLTDEGLINQIEIVKNLECNLDNDYNLQDQEKISLIWKASQERFENWNIGLGDYNPIFNEFTLFDSYFKSGNYIENLAKYFYYSFVNGITNIIDFDSGSDLKNVNNVVLDLSVSGLSLPSCEYYKSEKFRDKMVSFRDHLKNVKSLLKGYNLGDDFEENVIEFETKIAKYTMTPDQSREYDQYYTNTNLDLIYKEANSLRSLERKKENYLEGNKEYFFDENMSLNFERFFVFVCDYFQLKDKLDANYKKNFAESPDPPESKFQITVFDGDAIRRSMKLLLDSENFTRYKSFIQYKIIKNFGGFCTKELDEELFDFYSRKLGGQQKQKSDDKRSIGIVNGYAGEMLGKLYVEKYFPETSKKVMGNMITNVLDVMNKSLTSSNWLTDITKQKAVAKLSRFKSKIGYPDIWKDYGDFNIKVGDSLYDISKKARKWRLRVDFFEKINSVLDREEWHMTPQTVNAYFSPIQNEIVFPAAILQPPFFHRNTETIDFDISEEIEMIGKAYGYDSDKFDFVTPCNYGGIGAVIAHEITHGYDDKGRKFDGDGNLNDWWTEEDTKLFTDKTEIIVDSVEKYVYKPLDENKEYKMNAQLTMGENLADIGGLSLSMKALLKHLHYKNADSLTIKMSLRVFFKSWANVWKQNIKKDRRIMLLNMDPHAPTDFRGNLVQHIDEFYYAFDIKESDKMFLEQKYRMNMW
jgi:putative endopeptidase